MYIRTMREGDYLRVRALWESCEGMGLNDVDDSAEGFSRFLARNPTTCLVAAEADRIVGAVLVGYDGRRAYVYHLAVDSLCRRRGVGRELVEAAMSRLGELGATKAALVVFSHNEAGNAFWEGMGFRERGDLSYRDRALVETVRTDT